ncbi:hypothetical protein FRC01_003432 [Tulasnella sp. 417]|nr:hypothetical protein FRC01_003432 [Tulasnella sp. 417]
MEDTSSLFAERLEAVDTVKEIVYWGRAEHELIDFPALFGTIPSLRIFRGEVWLDFSTEDDFLQELLSAFALTPHPTEFEIWDPSYSLASFFDVAQADISLTSIASREVESLYGAPFVQKFRTFEKSPPPIQKATSGLPDA